MDNIYIQRIICILIGYACGNIITGMIIGKIKGVDLTKEGSGNPGSTNSLRTMGVGAGVMTLAGDCLKCILAVFLAWLVFHNRVEGIKILMAYAAFGCVLGHDFPIALKFKGGKGVACTLGMVIAVFPYCFPIAAIFFLVPVFITKYVSLGSMIAVVAVAINAMVLVNLGIVDNQYFGNEKIEIQVIAWIFAILIIILHHKNIGRLIRGEENKLSFKSKRE